MYVCFISDADVVLKCVEKCLYLVNLCLDENPVLEEVDDRWHYFSFQFKVNKWTQELLQSDPHPALIGNPFPKRWQLNYPNLTEYIFNLLNN